MGERVVIEKSNPRASLFWTRPISERFISQLSRRALGEINLKKGMEDLTQQESGLYFVVNEKLSRQT